MAAPFNRPDQAPRTCGARITNALRFDRSPHNRKPEHGSADCVQAFKEKLISPALHLCLLLDEEAQLAGEKAKPVSWKA
jgi:hypothetical protein